MTRAERHAQVVALKQQGLTFDQVAARLGLARSTVTSAYYDPTGEKERERKDRYANDCLDCGKRLDGSDGTKSAVRCVACANVIAGAARKVWTREKIIAAIQEWAAEHGQPPTTTNWHPGHARAIGHPELSAAYEAEPDRWPSHTQVCREFQDVGSWNAAIAAAGFTPRRTMRASR